MEKRNAEELLEKYHAGTATEEERAWVETWYTRFEDKAEHVPEQEVIMAERQSREAFEREHGFGRTVSLWPKIAAAACLLAVISTAAYFITREPVATPDTAALAPEQDVAPGGNKAVLTLANGRQITLDDAGDGQLASQSGITITKTANGRIVYTVAKQSSQDVASINTITTPKGGQYEIVLPDGTQVWLNAASSLKYPISFTGTGRQVELTGEAYFEVAHDKTRPFRVVSSGVERGQMVEVLGTHFNINAYNDEVTTKTTLIEGAVKIHAATGQKVLRPGQQSALSDKGMEVKEVDTDETVAWKNGYFLFNEEDLASIMRKVSRWYDVEVEYADNKLMAQAFSGTVSRYKNVSQVLRVLELTKAAHFKIDGKKIIITP